MKRVIVLMLIGLALAGPLFAACGDDSDGSSDKGGTGTNDGGGDEADASEGKGEPGGGKPVAQRLFVATATSLVAYDAESGEELPGAVQGIETPVDLYVLDDGHVMVNLTTKNETLVVDGRTMLEVARIPTSKGDAVRPVHGYISPMHNGKQYWVVFNDGEKGMLETNGATFIDITPGSKTRFKQAGETGLGLGHHKAAFSTTKERVVISNIADCDNVMSVYDYSDITDIKLLATLTAEQAGFDGSSRDTTCDVTYMNGAPPSPHGCATSKLSGNAYCNITTSGDIAVIDIDAAKPTFTLIPTAGSGSGKTISSAGGAYIYSVQEDPRGECSIGQLIVIDAKTDKLVDEMPIGYTGPDCTDDLTGTAAESANPDRLGFSKDGKTLFIGVAGGFMMADARVSQVVVVDVSTPAAPKQLPSIEVGESTGHSSGVVSGDGKYLFSVESSANSVARIDTKTLKVIDQIDIDAPKVVATWGSEEGPNAQTGPIK